MTGRRAGAAAAVAVAALTAGFFLKGLEQGTRAGSAAALARALGGGIAKSELRRLLVAPGETRIRLKGRDLAVEYTLDSRLQKSIEETYRRAKVPYGAFVAIDPSTGKVRAMVSHGMLGENLALRATFPAASIFKIVTAAAAVEAGKLRHDSLIPVQGSFHTLYRRNLFAAGGLDPERRPRYARLIRFEDAMAKSVNSVFGKVGIFGVGPEAIRQAAARFGFNREIPFELPLGVSRAEIPDDLYGVAESASGFTRLNTLSPLHGAMLAAAVVNEGVMMEPAVVQRVTDRSGRPVYEFEPAAFANSTDAKTAEELRIMLRRTITNGTSRGAFRGAFRIPAFERASIGGKTGTLNGWDPAGRYDWFVGFAESGGTKLAVSALCIHGPWRGMKASRVAREAFETYFAVAARHAGKREVVARNEF